MPEPSTTPVISVVVPAHNAEVTLSTTLAALLSQSLDVDYEVLVVDSDSSDGTLATAQHWAQMDNRIRVGVNPSGEPAGSRNLGVEAARADLIAFTDADCAPEPGWLAAGLAALGDADLVQGRVLPAEPHRMWDRTLSVGHESGLYETANLFLRREVFERVGGFRPLPGFGEERPFGEDTWFAWRARRAGALTAFCADAVVHHAIFPRRPAGYVAEQRRRGYFPALVAAVPELRGGFLYRRWFLSRQTAAFDLALAGIAASVVAGLHQRRCGDHRHHRHDHHRDRWALVAAVPYLLGLPRTPVSAAVQFAADAVGAVALFRGSLRSRTPVL